MPIYTFENTKTNEVFVKEMKISERETYLEENPDLTHIIQSIPQVSPYSVGRKKTDTNFRNLLNNINEKHPNSAVRGDNLTEL